MGRIIDLNEKRDMLTRRRRQADCQDAIQQQNFDELLRCAERAWEYRDPESIHDLANMLQVCALQVEEEWQESIPV